MWPQDTVRAVQSLTEFALRTFASDLTTTVAVTAGGETVQRSVDATNRLLLQQSKVPDLTVSSTLYTAKHPPHSQPHTRRLLPSGPAPVIDVVKHFRVSFSSGVAGVLRCHVMRL